MPDCHGRRDTATLGTEAHPTQPDYAQAEGDEEGPNPGEYVLAEEIDEREPGNDQGQARAQVGQVGALVGQAGARQGQLVAEAEGGVRFGVGLKQVLRIYCAVQPPPRAR